MSSVVDFSGLTLNEEEARDSSEVVFEKLYEKPEITQVHEVMTGIQMDKRIPIMGRMGLLGAQDPGGCGVNTDDGTIPTSEKTWTPKLISGRIPHCQDQVPNLLKFWKKALIANQLWEDVDNEMVAFIEDRAADSLLESILRHAEFGDTDASPTNDATGDQKLTLGTEKKFFNVINGIWKQFYTDQALPTPKSYKYDIPENGAVTKAAQFALADDRALIMLRSMYSNIDSRAWQGTPVFQLTRSLFNNWQNFLEDKSLAFTLDRTEAGKVGLWQYRGIPIVIRDDWDRTIKQYYDNGTTYDLPHRAILADIAILPIGTSDTESMSEFDSFYVKKDKKWYMDYAYRIDAKILLEEETAVAY
jgi:hypothetical protein